jgi:hypothetical protein
VRRRRRIARARAFRELSTTAAGHLIERTDNHTPNTDRVERGGIARVIFFLRSRRIRCEIGGRDAQSRGHGHIAA